MSRPRGAEALLLQHQTPLAVLSWAWHCREAGSSRQPQEHRGERGHRASAAAGSGSGWSHPPVLQVGHLTQLSGPFAHPVPMPADKGSDCPLPSMAMPTPAAWQGWLWAISQHNGRGLVVPCPGTELPALPQALPATPAHGTVPLAGFATLRQSGSPSEASSATSPLSSLASPCAWY